MLIFSTFLLETLLFGHSSLLFFFCWLGSIITEVDLFIEDFLFSLFLTKVRPFVWFFFDFHDLCCYHVWAWACVSLSPFHLCSHCKNPIFSSCVLTLWSIVVFILWIFVGFVLLRFRTIVYSKIYGLWIFLRVFSSVYPCACGVV